MATRKVDKDTPLPQRRLSLVPSLHPRPAGRVETPFLTGSDIDATLLGAAEGEGWLGFAIAGGVIVASSGAAFGHDSSPRRGRVQAFDPCRLVLGCLRLAVIGRVSPRRVTIFLVATRKMDKKRPLPQCWLAPVPLLRPHPAVASKLALTGSDIDATIPATAGCACAQKGKAAGSASPLPAGFRAVSPVRAHAIRHDSSPRRRLGPGSLIFAVPFEASVRLLEIKRDWPRWARTSTREFLLAAVALGATEEESLCRLNYGHHATPRSSYPGDRQS